MTTAFSGPSSRSTRSTKWVSASRLDTSRSAIAAGELDRRQLVQCHHDAPRVVRSPPTARSVHQVRGSTPPPGRTGGLAVGRRLAKIAEIPPLRPHPLVDWTHGHSPSEDLPPEDTPLKQLAADLRAVRAELAPSLDRITNSSLSEDDKLGAMRLFASALDDPWNPFRDPAKAIAAQLAAG